MSRPSYSIAELKPEELEEIRRMERQLSEKAGHPISLIAYESNRNAYDSH